MKNKITIPTTPNFILCNRVSMAVSEYDNETLKVIGEIWVANLIKKARKLKGQDKEIVLQSSLPKED